MTLMPYIQIPTHPPPPPPPPPPFFFSMTTLYLEIGIIPIDSSKFKLWPFHAKLVILTILHSGLFEIPIFQCLNFIFETGFLYSFETKVLRVLLQLESPKSEHRNSLYVQNNRANLCSKTEPEFGLHMALL